MLPKVRKWTLVVIGALILWIGVVFLTSAVVKFRVPVQLSPGSSVINNGGFYVMANGTWVIEGDKQAFPLQTTQIRCEKEPLRCISGTAMVMSGDQLTVDVTVHEVASWNKSHIVFVDDAPECVKYIYTIDLATKSTNAVRQRRPDSANPNCSSYDKELRLSLRSGFREVQVLEREAVPWFGRLAMSPFELFR